MFKCTECDKIYDVKPDYCDDCGNDIFEEIVETPTVAEVKIKQEEVKQEPKLIVDDIKQSPKKTVEKPKKDIDYPSITFLIICILISLYIIFFAWNPKEGEIVQKEQNDTVKQDTKIPSSVDAFWNNELPKIQPKSPQQPVQKLEEQPKIVQPPQVQPPQPMPQPPKAKVPEIKKQPQPVIKQAQTVPKQPKQQVQAAKPVQQQTKVQATQKTTQVAKKPMQTVPKTQTQPAQTVKPSVVQTVQKPTTTQPVWQAVQQPQTQSAQSKATQTVDTAVVKKEFENYKINLRNAIGRKIDFANVVGDGSCTVSFKIASSGKIINRAFAKQSTNTTLNDAVYSAVMATPSYNPPPSGYNGGTLYLKISFYNGNFQISLN